MIEPKLPQEIYYLMAVMASLNLGAIGTVLFYGAKAVWSLSQIIHRIEKAEVDITGVGKKGREQEATIKQHEIRLTKIETRMEK
jgi:hypothetical protein